jgi:predicted nucleic acid-binding protein
MKQQVVVTNAGPLIYLAVVRRFSLLNHFFSTILVPEAVYEEVVLLGNGQPGAIETQAAIETGWLQRAVVQDRIAVDGLLDKLHIGEAEAIVFARELGEEKVLLDDRAARNKAQLMGLKVTGTVGILLLAQQAGIIENIRPELDRLIKSNFRMSRQLYNQLCE